MILLGDKWYSDEYDMVEDLFEERSDIDNYPNGITVVSGVLEPMIQVNLDDFYDFFDKKCEDRLGEDGEGMDEVAELFTKHFNIEAFNAEMTKYYYAERGSEIHFDQEQLYKIFDEQ